MKGQSGERGCFQFMPATWDSYSKKVFGSKIEKTEQNEIIVAEAIILEKLEQNWSERDIFLLWNQGNRGQCKSGINKYGVKYDSCAYAEKALKQFKHYDTIDIG